MQTPSTTRDGQRSSLIAKVYMLVLAKSSGKTLADGTVHPHTYDPRRRRCPPMPPDPHARAQGCHLWQARTGPSRPPASACRSRPSCPLRSAAPVHTQYVATPCRPLRAPCRFRPFPCDDFQELLGRVRRYRTGSRSGVALSGLCMHRSCPAATYDGNPRGS